MRTRPAVILGVALGLAAPSAAVADEQTAVLGSVRATFSFERQGESKYRDLRLTVSRAGAVLFDRPVALPKCSEPYCFPVGIHRGRKAVRVRDLEDDGEPEVLLDMFSGGAHCCAVTWALRFNGRGYTARARDWRDAGYRFADVDGDGTLEMRSADARFAYEFASFADSGFPVQVFSFRRGRFVDVTRRHEALVRRDARRWMRLYRKRRDGPYSLGVIAAWTADQYLLGRKRQAHRFLEAERRAGRLRAAVSRQSGAVFIRTLKRRLRAWGY
jgi:hypothetical protein